MEKLIAYCGLDCVVCPAYIARKNNDDELRKKTAQEWSKMFNVVLKPEEINCDGCSVTGKHITYCENFCEMRKCAIEKKVINCAYCKDYACENLTAFLNQVPEAKQRLDEIAKDIRR
uniref:DUF3795 domain-containing protein n=1 Tax=candidate division WOR-3 bacterium TaxID=2052148 RepID=A0A7V1EHH9_UNCW3